MDLKDYKLGLKTQLLDSFFVSKQNINGKEILSFCDEKQINMFVVFLLLKEWKLSMENLKSSYFDFNNTEVKEALNSYMNTVSKHISIQKVDFEPLLEKAIDYTFQLVENPESFIVSNHLENDLQEMSKYIQYHKPYFEGNLDYEVESKIDEVKKKFAIETSEDLSQNNQPQEKVISETKVEQTSTQKPIVDLYQEEDEEHSVVLKKIENIKNAISINQKFIFINDVFGGNTEQYNVIIERLEKCSGFDEAKEIVSNLDVTESNKEAIDQLSLLIKQKYNF